MLGGSASPLTLCCILASSFFALFLCAVNGANGPDLEIGSQLVGKAYLPSELIGTPFDLAFVHLRYQAFSTWDVEPRGIVVQPGINSARAVGQPAEVMGEYPGNGYRGLGGCQLAAAGVFEPSGQF